MQRNFPQKNGFINLWEQTIAIIFGVLLLRRQTKRIDIVNSV